MIELKLDDIYDKTTYTFSVFQAIVQEQERLQKKYDREREINFTLWHYLHKYGTISDEKYRCFIAWCQHSNEDISKIGEAIFDDNDKIILSQERVT